LGQITPLLLTLDERPNLERTFAALDWARRIVVVDSGSTDGTREWLARDPRVALFERPFDHFAAQCDFGLRETGIATEWVLSLDADHVLTPELVAELDGLAAPAEVAGYEARFVYCIAGRRLRRSLYPPRVVLARRTAMRYVADGHAHRVEAGGRVERLRAAILHDDRKPRERFLAAQAVYARAEAAKLLAASAGELPMRDRLRRAGWIAPWLVPLWYLLVHRGLFDGRPGWIYAAERGVAEWILAMSIFEKRVQEGGRQSG